MARRRNSARQHLILNEARPGPVGCPRPDGDDSITLQPDLRKLSIVGSTSLIRHLDVAAESIADARYLLAGALQMLDTFQLSGTASADLRLRLQAMRQQLDELAFTARQLAAEVA